ncbi:hypothetical protein N5079_04960 [Planotetraspora sp. A-T 1434]|nr:hypothetical protein [Planotetraspora sp. A-T 1434]MCT9929567.1 hypothetical protein [Planotetraspora sp. A-T 1434]
MAINPCAARRERLACCTCNGTGIDCDSATCRDCAGTGIDNHN